MKFYLYNDEAKQWSTETYTLGQLARIIHPSENPSICPVMDNGEAGQSIFYRQYLKALNNLREQKNGVMETIGNFLTADLNPPKPKSYTPQQNIAGNGEQRNMKELEHIDMLPPEVRAVDYLLRHTSLPNLIEEMRSLVKNASSLIAFIIFVNIFALAVGLIAIVVSIGR